MKKMAFTKEELRALYPEPTPGFAGKVQHALTHLLTEEEKPVMKKKLSLSFALIILLVCILGAVAIAAILSPTADIFGWLYGAQTKQELIAGDLARVGQSFTFGDVTYTLEEVIHKRDGDITGLYGVITISVAEGKEAVLIPEEYSVTAPAGYLLYYGKDEIIPEDAPSYADLARQKGCKLLMVKASAKSLIVNGETVPADVGYTQLPQPDGTIRYTMEVLHFDDILTDSYDLSFFVANWEVTLTGEHLRKDPKSSWLNDDWVVTITPELEGR